MASFHLRIQPTYEDETTNRPSYLVPTRSIQPTYEELKQEQAPKRWSCRHDIQPTYEGIETQITTNRMTSSHQGTRIQPT